MSQDCVASRTRSKTRQRTIKRRLAEECANHLWTRQMREQRHRRQCLEQRRHGPDWVCDECHTRFPCDEISMSCGVCRNKAMCERCDTYVGPHGVDSVCSDAKCRLEAAYFAEDTDTGLFLIYNTPLPKVEDSDTDTDEDTDTDTDEDTDTDTDTDTVPKVEDPVARKDAYIKFDQMLEDIRDKFGNFENMVDQLSGSDIWHYRKELDLLFQNSELKMEDIDAKVSDMFWEIIQEWDKIDYELNEIRDWAFRKLGVSELRSVSKE